MTCWCATRLSHRRVFVQMRWMIRSFPVGRAHRHIIFVGRHRAFLASHDACEQHLPLAFDGFEQAAVIVGKRFDAVALKLLYDLSIRTPTSANCAMTSRARRCLLPAWRQRSRDP